MSRLFNERLLRGGKQPLGGDACVDHEQAQRSRSSRIISSVEGKGPAVRGGRLCNSSTLSNSCRRLFNSAAVGTSRLSSEITSLAMDVRFCLARFRKAAYRSAGTFSTYKVGICFPYGKHSTSLGIILSLRRAAFGAKFGSPRDGLAAIQAELG